MRLVFYLPALLAATLSLCSTQGKTQVINELYVGGGNAGATYTNDAVVLRGTPGASLSGWSLQYTSASGTSWNLNIVSFSGSSVFNSSGFFYLQFAGGVSGGAALPNPPFTSGSTSYATSTINMSATGGKIALVSSTSGLQTVICPTPTAGTVAPCLILWGMARPIAQKPILLPYQPTLPRSP
jgi:hypothetical protein